MTRATALLLILTCLPLAGGCVGSPEAAPTAEPLSAREAARIGRVVDAWHDAAARGDWNAYAARMTDDVVFLGTDKTERWAGPTFTEFARPYFKGPTPYGEGAWTYRSVERHVGGRGPVAWWDERLVHDRYGNCRGTGVLLRDDAGAWRITHYSLTFPVPNEIAPEVVGLIRAHEASQ